MILVNNSPCGPFGGEFSERGREREDRQKEEEREKERGPCLVTVIHFEYNQALLL